MKRTSGTKEWADYNVNCVHGCSNDCRYCYAKMIGKRFGRCSENTWKNMVINKNALLKKYPKYNGRVMFPSSHDIVNNFDIKTACFKVISNLLNSDNDVLITTKPDFEVTKNIIEEFSDYKENLQFRFTITSKNNVLLKFWERDAPNYEDRLESLIIAFKEGFKTSVSIEPFLDYEPKYLVNEVSPYITESLWIGPMNYIPRNNIPREDVSEYEKIRKNYEIEHLKTIYQELKDYAKIRFKDSMILKLGLPLNRV